MKKLFYYSVVIIAVSVVLIMLLGCNENEPEQPKSYPFNLRITTNHGNMYETVVWERVDGLRFNYYTPVPFTIYLDKPVASIKFLRYTAGSLSYNTPCVMTVYDNANNVSLGTLMVGEQLLITYNEISNTYSSIKCLIE